MIAGERPACSRGQVSGESGVGRGVGRVRPSRPHSRAHSACGPFLSLCCHLCSTSRKTFLDLRSFLRDPPLCCFPYSRQGFSWAVLELTLWAMRLALPLSAGERCAQPLPRQERLKGGPAAAKGSCLFVAASNAEGDVFLSPSARKPTINIRQRQYVQCSD